LDFQDNVNLSFAQNILNNFNNYNDKAIYDDMPFYETEDDGKYNCNSFTNTINGGDLPASMADPEITYLFPGLIDTMPNKYFE
jgi:hypothetical protein